MSYALIFSGQGTQHANMLPWLEKQEPARAVLAAAARHTGGNWRGLLADESCGLTNARCPQSALRPLLRAPPAIVAGYSIGEIAACSAAGMLAAEEAVTLSATRARVMYCAVARKDTGMVAVSGIAEEEVLASCAGLETAIRIDRETNVFGANRAALANAKVALGDRAQVKDICVVLASHTSWMRDATAAFLGALNEMRFAPPACPIALNATGEAARDVGEIDPALASQLSRTVEWRSCMAAIAERQPACVLEIGGGQALARTWTARYAQIPARSLDEFRTCGGAATWIDRQNLT